MFLFLPSYLSFFPFFMQYSESFALKYKALHPNWLEHSFYWIVEQLNNYLLVSKANKDL